MVAATVDVLQVTHGYQGGHHSPHDSLAVLDKVSFSVEAGKFLALLGPSGSGKSTLLRLLAGLEQPLYGFIYIDGAKVTRPHPSRALMFQDPTLLPWRTVEQNVRLGLDARGERDPVAVAQAIDLVGLTEFKQVLPALLSGGMAQRAALARSIVGKPDLLLLDEPLGKLDALTRGILQNELERLWQSQGFTAILVTHDIEEALILADRIVIFSSRPARVIGIVENPLMRPRLRDHENFLELRRQIGDILSLPTI